MCPLTEFVHLKRVKLHRGKHTESINTLNLEGLVSVIPFGLVVRIPGFHPGGPGSIPGVGSYFFFFFFLCVCVIAQHN